jgi:hypothetical protein
MFGLSNIVAFRGHVNAADPPRAIVFGNEKLHTRIFPGTLRQNGIPYARCPGCTRCPHADMAGALQQSWDLRHHWMLCGNAGCPTKMGFSNGGCATSPLHALRQRCMPYEYGRKQRWMPYVATACLVATLDALRK